nr:MAG TPA: hypothetical protein [Caudoviricetes sp.]
MTTDPGAVQISTALGPVQRPGASCAKTANSKG